MVLADASFAATAPGDWQSAGEIEIRDFGRHIEVFTLPDAAAEARANPVAATVVPDAAAG